VHVELASEIATFLFENIESFLGSRHSLLIGFEVKPSRIGELRWGLKSTLAISSFRTGLQTHGMITLLIM